VQENSKSRGTTEFRNKLSLTANEPPDRLMAKAGHERDSVVDTEQISPENGTCAVEFVQGTL